MNQKHLGLTGLVLALMLTLSACGSSKNNTAGIRCAQYFSVCHRNCYGYTFTGSGQCNG